VNEATSVRLKTAEFFRFSAIILLVLTGPFSRADAQTITALWPFTGGSDGAYPYGALIQGTDGNFYGTASGGGASGSGTVFRISASGTFTNLHIFQGSDGMTPYGALAAGIDGNFYGTTYRGGASNNGTVFRISPSGTFTSLYSFGISIDGIRPQAGLVQGTDSNFYGTTEYGGASTNCFGGCGTVFRMSPTGSLTNLHSFSGRSDGSAPYGGLLQGSDGNFYGTTPVGGASNNGVVFWMSPSGTLTDIYAFTGIKDGGFPEDKLVQGSDGNFYGTTYYGGLTNFFNGQGYGTVFRISPSGNLTNLHAFNGSDGNFPEAGLVQGSDGNFYGTTSGGPPNSSYGSAFQITPSGTLTLLYTFNCCSYGTYPYAGLVQGSDGSFYGAIYSGGANGKGNIIKLTVPLNPPANQISAVQALGNNAYLSIPSVAGETYQLQFCTNLTSGAWSNVPGVVISNSIGALLTVTNLAGTSSPQGFYRFDVTP
jgi:uncharacterized repeat protein (TIGR03803 family)